MIGFYSAGAMGHVVAPPTGWAAAISADSPYLWWRLGEASGTAAADSSGNSRPGTYNGSSGTAYDLGESGLVGDVNTAVEIKSNAGFVRSNTSHAMGNSGVATTLALAIRVNNGASGGALLTKHDATNPTVGTGNREAWMYVGTDGYLRAGAWTGSQSVITSSMAVNDGVRRLIHYRIGANGTDGLQLFIDGALQGSLSVSPALTYNGFITVGRNNISGWTSGSDAAALGIVDELAIFNSRLSNARIAAHAAAGGF